jgi:hypothetical protein
MGRHAGQDRFVDRHSKMAEQSQGPSYVAVHLAYRRRDDAYTSRMGSSLRRDFLKKVPYEYN